MSMIGRFLNRLLAKRDRRIREKALDATVDALMAALDQPHPHSVWHVEGDGSVTRRIRQLDGSVQVTRFPDNAHMGPHYE